MATPIEAGVYRSQVAARHARGNRMRAFYMSSLLLAFAALIALLANIIDGAFGLVAVDFEISPDVLSDRPLTELSSDELAALIVEHNPGQLLMQVYENLSPLGEMRAMSGVPLSESIAGATIPEGWAERPINDLAPEERSQLLAVNLDSAQMVDIVYADVVREQTLESWTLSQSVLGRGEIDQHLIDDIHVENPTAELKWRSWVSLDFIRSSLSRVPGNAGIFPAFMGTIWLLSMTALIAFPIGVGAAFYLEEYASHTWYNKIIEINIRNLAGVPSIIYGMLGLAIFVRALETFTNGSMFGAESANGRTILSAAATLALLILPIIIAGTQEAIRAVPSALREASYGLGATKWQTISRQIFPAALPGILTGTIIALSRAIGETAPLIVVGAATFINVNPDGPFSQFTALPILIYNWTSQPDPQFQNAAAAAIIVLLVLLLTMNSIAIILRNMSSQRR